MAAAPRPNKTAKKIVEALIPERPDTFSKEAIEPEVRDTEMYLAETDLRD